MNSWHGTFILVLSLMMVVTPPTSGNASEVDGRKGIGFASAIGGPSGLALGYGVGNIYLEGIIGVSRYEAGVSGREPITLVGVGVASHFQVLRSRFAALSVGARLNVGAGSADSSSVDATAIGLEENHEITQFGFDLPLRIYWFPDRHVSLHTEVGVAVLIAPSEGVLFGRDDANGRNLERDGVAVHAFRGAAPAGELGLTFWW